MLQKTADGAAGAVIGSILGAVIGTVVAYPLLAAIHWMTYHSWQEFWGEIGALVYGGPIGAGLGAIVGACLNVAGGGTAGARALGQRHRRLAGQSPGGTRTELPARDDYFRPQQARELRKGAARWARAAAAIHWLSLVSLILAVLFGIGTASLMGGGDDLLSTFIQGSCFAFFSLLFAGGLFVTRCAFQDRGARLRERAEALEAEHAARCPLPDEAG